MTEPFALKYRPKVFSQMVGQRSAVKILKGMLKEGLPPTILLYGEHSTGKTTLGRILARTANCSDPNDDGPCGKCDSCSYTDKQHPDISEINAASERGIDIIRHLSEVSMLAPSFNRRVYLLDEVHAVTPQAFQAALKLFEEPPPTSCFILLTTTPDKLPPTILSRCSKVGLKPLGTKLLGGWLAKIAKKEGVKIDTEYGETIANACGGYPREALHMLEQVVRCGGEKVDIVSLINMVTQDVPFQLTSKFVKAIMDGKLKSAMKLARHTENAERFLEECVSMLQEVLRYSVDKDLVDGKYRSQLGGFKVHPVDAADVLKVFAETLSKVKAFVLPATIALDLAIVASMPED